MTADPLCIAPPAAAVLEKLSRAINHRAAVMGLAANGGPHTPEQLAAQLSAITLEARCALLPDRFALIDRQLGFLVRCMTTTGTIGEALHCLADYGSAHWSDLAEVWVKEGDGRIAVHSQPVSKDLTRCFIHELRSAAVGLMILDWLSGGKLTGLRVEFDRAPLPAEDIARIFPYEVGIGAATTRLSMRAADSKKPVVRTPDHVAAFLKQKSLYAFQGASLQTRAGEDVRRLIERALQMQAKVPCLEEICQMLSTSPATLHRRLRAEGASFRAARDEILNARAKRLLSETNASISSISVQLGYSEESPFRRSFNRWNGCSPSAYRGLSTSSNLHEHTAPNGQVVGNSGGGVVATAARRGDDENRPAA